MSWNPFKKKDNAEPGPDAQTPPETPAPPADTPAPSPVPVSPVDDDDTQPIMDAGTVTERATLVSEMPGLWLERVEVLGGEGVSDTFLRLLVADAEHPAAGLKRALMELPEELTGFRDMLARDGYALAAAFDITDTNLRAVMDGYFSSDNPAPDYIRPRDVLDILAAMARFCAALETSCGLAWPGPSPAGIGLSRTRADLPEGLWGWQPVFTAWDELQPGRGNPAELVEAVLPLLELMAQRLAQSSFPSGFMVLRWVTTGIMELTARPGLTYAQLAEACEAVRPQFMATGLTDNGMRRDHNEDAFLNFQIDQASSTGNQFQLAVVADGMGGHASGEVASSLALDLLRQQLMLGLLTPRSQPVPTVKLLEQLEAVIPAIDRALTQRAEMEPALAGMGTTLAGVAVLRQSTTLAEGGKQILGEETAAVFHVGDSRVYSFGPAGLKRLSRDHSFVQGLVDSGSITPEEAFSHPRKNVITRCLGGGQSDSTPDINRFTPGPGELLLIASDGLSDALRDGEIEAILRTPGTGSLDDLARALIDAANHAGGPDNITVILVACVVPPHGESAAIIH